MSDEQNKSEALAHWYKSILDATPYPITVTDKNMCWTFINKAVEDFLGVKREDIIGQPCSNWNAHICNTDDCGIACAKRGLKRTFFNQQGRAHQVDVEILRDLNGEISGFIEVVQDITDIEEMHKKQAEAETASLAKSMFLAKMSHEFRTPMNAVLGMSELLLQENLNKRQLGHVVDIKTSAMALLDIINDILDVSKIQLGKFTLIPVHYNFSMMIDNVASNMQFMTENKSIEFRLTVPEQNPVYLYGDSGRLRQALLNLLGNAVKFTERGYIELTVSFTDDTVKITVSDTGAGIPAEGIATLFDAFVQADVEKHLAKTGTGIGLTITKSIIEMMDGKLTVESIYGEGTSFIIEIPKIIGDKALVQNSSEKEVIIYAPKAKILVVDDIKTNLNVACGLLKLCGIKADTAESGSEAIELIRQYPYDIVFMDHRMPGMSGMETTKLIREEGINVTIVALTASAVVGAKEMMLDAGMNDFLWKPIKKTELLHILQKWIPADKLKEPSPDTTADKEDDGEEDKAFWAALEKVEELSLATGLIRVDGQRDVYKQSLKLLIQEIKKCIKNLSEFLTNNDMENFRIEVHGIKGALANVGAMNLSAKALVLEKASAEMNADFCAVNLSALINGLSDLGGRLEDSFALFKHSDGEALLPHELFSIFQNMTEAFAEMDLMAIDEEIGRLDSLNLKGAIKAEIDDIKDMVMMMDYDGAAERMGKMG
ncbi:MAG: ATP-binding protein [Lachnospiraceae bacterium]|nr:ATP-binding protein [Lachnospiraceae bacterium]